METQSEWPSGDERPIVTLELEAIEPRSLSQLEIHDYVEDGLGVMREYYGVFPSGDMVSVRCHYDSPSPTELVVYVDSKLVSAESLNQVLSFFEVVRTDLSWVSPLITEA